MIKLTLDSDRLDAMRQTQLARKGLIALLQAFEEVPDATQFVKLEQIGMLFEVLDDIDEAAHTQKVKSSEGWTRVVNA